VDEPVLVRDVQRPRHLPRDRQGARRLERPVPLDERGQVGRNEAIGDTRPAAGDGPAPELTDAQRRVLVALCRPYRHGDAYARPATTREICAEVHLGPDAVRTHLRALFEKLAVEDLPGGEKRLRLVELALRRGAVTARDLAAQI